MEKEVDSQAYLSSSEESIQYKLSGRLTVLEERLHARLRNLLERNSSSHNTLDIHSPELQWGKVIEYLKEKGAVDFFYMSAPFNDETKLYFLQLLCVLNKQTTDGIIPHDLCLGRGISDYFNEAMSKVIGEFLERYALLIYKEQNLIRASSLSLKKSNKSFISPQLLSNFNKKQKEKFSDLNLSEKSIFRWVVGNSLIDNREVLIPAQIVFWNYSRCNKNNQEPRIREANTNGAGGYFTKEGAILSGLYELIQRDAFLVNWFNNLSPRRIINKTITEKRLKTLIEKAEKLGFEIYFLDTTLDIHIPTCVCVVRDPTGVGPHLSFGGGCGSSAVAVLRRSLTEALGLYHSMREYGCEESVRQKLKEPYIPFIDSTIGQTQRISLWGDKEMYKYINFLLSGENITFDEFTQNEHLFQNEKKELEWVVSLVSSFGDGYEPVYYEAKHSILREMGYHSVKVVVPKLVPLYLNEHNAPIAADRIQDSLRHVGIRPAKRINTLPQPFP